MPGQSPIGDSAVNEESRAERRFHIARRSASSDALLTARRDGACG
jgi:hypothetical protein